jgi:hypothetical protein
MASRLPLGLENQHKCRHITRRGRHVTGQDVPTSTSRSNFGTRLITASNQPHTSIFSARSFSFPSATWERGEKNSYNLFTLPWVF